MRSVLAKVLLALSAPSPRPAPLLRAIATTLLELLGLALIVLGIALIWQPAACIVAGAALLVLSWRATR